MKGETLDHWLEDIRVRLIERPRHEVINPEMLPGVLDHILCEMARAAGGLTDEEYAAEWATELLYEVWNHVSTNTPFSESREPLYVDVLDADERGGR